MLWEMATGTTRDYNVLVSVEEGNVWVKYFRATGKEMHWPDQPKVMPYVDPKRKQQKLRSDIEYLTWGAIVLNDRAYVALRETLEPFGQFLELDCLGVVHYFYNVTTLFSVVDYENSRKTGPAVTKPVFFEKNTPDGFHIFKDELTATTAIYLTEAAKDSLEQLTIASKLTGLYFVPAGSL
jgi:hypothetical protein